MSSNVTREAILAKSDQLDRWQAYADAMLALGFRLGRGELEAMTYAEAFDLGHDTGLGVRQDCRAIVRGIIDGYSAGCQARHRLVAELLGKGERCDNGAAGKQQELPNTATQAAATTRANSAPWSSPPTHTASGVTG